MIDTPVEVDKIIEGLEQQERQPEGINDALLEKVIEVCERSWWEFDMNNWGHRLPVKTGWFHRLLVKVGLVTETLREYTVGCVACHTVRLGGGDGNVFVPAEAQRLLNITFEQANRLFYSHNWPQPFKQEYERCGDDDLCAVRAWIAANRFRHFINTKGAE